jgi:hypothetical protein
LPEAAGECKTAWDALVAVNEAVDSVRDDAGPYKALLALIPRRAERYLEAVKRMAEALEV